MVLLSFLQHVLIPMYISYLYINFHLAKRIVFSLASSPKLKKIRLYTKAASIALIIVESSLGEWWLLMRFVWPLGAWKHLGSAGQRGNI